MKTHSIRHSPNIRGLAVFRTIYYLPAILSGVAVAILWQWIFSSDFGLLNTALRIFGIEGPAWLGSKVWVLPAFVIMRLWSVGGGMVIYLAGLQAIPTDLYEAAEIDGANWWQRIFRITLPMSKPVLAAVAIFSFQFHWNDFFRPLIFLFSDDNYTLALGLRFFQGTYGTEWNSLMAVSLVVMLPLIIVFFFTQKYFIQGVVFTGYK